MFGYKRLMNRIDTIVMGSKSYKQILTFGDWAWPDKHTYVFTSKPMESKLACVKFTDDTPAIFMEKKRRNQVSKDIWLLGGAMLAQSFAKVNLIDEIILTIIPTKLEQGISLNILLDNFILDNAKPCIDGMIQKLYLRKEV